MNDNYILNFPYVQLYKDIEINSCCDTELKQDATKLAEFLIPRSDQFRWSTDNDINTFFDQYRNIYDPRSIAIGIKFAKAIRKSLSKFN